MTKQQKERIQFLFLQYLEGVSSDKERQELSVLLTEEKDDDSWQDIMEEIFVTERAMDNYQEKEWQHIIEDLIGQNNQPKKSGRSLVKQISFWRKIAAAVVLLVLLGGYFVYKTQIVNRKSEIVHRTDVEAPKSTKAIITLADGRQISIDSLSTITQGNVLISKTTDGKIVYNGSEKEVIYNTLFNPQGSKVIDMTLADGSHVWLNAGSSVTYPIAFIGNERNVSIIGEAYFEVAHNSSMPFTVSKGNTRVQVMGTRFNMNAYDEEAAIKVTLLEGSVKVSNNQNSQTIKPYQQTVVQENSITLNTNVNVEEVMAWKNGRFFFDNASIESIMKEISRWYDVQVVYEGKISGGFGGDLSRDNPVSKLLQIMEASNRVHFEIVGKTVKVRP